MVNLEVSGLKEPIFVENLVMPEICNSLIKHCSKIAIQENYPHLQGLRFTDFSNLKLREYEYQLDLIIITVLYQVLHHGFIKVL